MSCAVMQWQILAKDPEAASAFYTSLFGWRVNSDNPLGYRVVDTGSTDGIQGGIWPSPADGHNFVQLFIRVSSVAEYLRARRTARGTYDHSSTDIAGGRRNGHRSGSARHSVRAHWRACRLTAALRADGRSLRSRKGRPSAGRPLRGRLLAALA